ncbi:MAG: DUF5687 family protein [Bacteroidota bacterium]
MILKWIIKNQWKQSLRSSIWQKNVALNIIMGIGLLYFIVNFLLLGIFAKDVLREIFPDEDPVIKFNGFLLYFMGMDMLLRFLMQAVPTLSIQPYLHLPTKRSSLMHYLLCKSLVNPINYFYFLIFIPFAINGVSYYYDFHTAILWLFSILMIVWFDNFIITYFKRQLGIKPLFTLGFALVFASMFFLDYFKIFSLRNVSELVFTKIMIQKTLLLILALMVVVVYYLNFSFLKKNAYPEEIGKKFAKKSVHAKDISFIKQFGVIGELLNLEIKLMLRNKRSKTIIYMTPIFIFYGFFFYPQELYMNMGGMLVFVGIFISGGFMFSYGNYLISWESGYFDLIMSNNIDFKKYFQEKFFLLASVTAISYIITLFYAFLNIKLLYINTACFIFNIGFNVHVIMYFALNNKKYIDLNRQAAFNFQGVSSKNFLVMLPAMFLPVLIYLPFSFFISPVAGLIVLSCIGILGLLLHNKIVNYIVKEFHNKKYEMAEGFRQRS